MFLEQMQQLLVNGKLFVSKRNRAAAFVGVIDYVDL